MNRLLISLCYLCYDLQHYKSLSHTILPKPTNSQTNTSGSNTISVFAEYTTYQSSSSSNTSQLIITHNFDTRVTSQSSHLVCRNVLDFMCSMFVLSTFPRSLRNLYNNCERLSKVLMTLAWRAYQFYVKTLECSLQWNNQYTCPFEANCSFATQQ